MTERSGSEQPKQVGREHAVVIGASMAGLLAASALSEFYQQVTVIERDKLPAVGSNRKAVPQGRHAHVLLESGLRSIEELLPGITDELRSAGAQTCEALRQVRFVLSGHEITREAVGADILLASRPFIEGHVRRRVLAIDNVTVREKTDMQDLATSEDRSRVSGVRIRSRTTRALEQVNSDLVVMASGRGARATEMLESIGYESPKVDRLDVDLMYVSRRIRPTTGALGEDKLIVIGPRPGLPRGAMLIEQEDHWIVTASGYGSEHRPPTDDEGFLRFIASVAPHEVFVGIRDAEPLGEIVTHGFPANQRRLYERLKRFPEGLLVIGDAICSFNPLYGQGMSVAALEAMELRRCLREGDDGLARRFFRAAGKVVDMAWGTAIGGDLALPEVEGRRPLALRLINAYIARLMQVSEHDPVVASAFNRVGDLVAPPSEVLRPQILWRVLRPRRRKARSSAAREATEDRDARSSAAIRKAIVRDMGRKAATVREHTPPTESSSTNMAN